MSELNKYLELDRYLYGAGGYHNDAQLDAVLKELSDRIERLENALAYINARL